MEKTKKWRKVRAGELCLGLNGNQDHFHYFEAKSILVILASIGYFCNFYILKSF